MVRTQLYLSEIVYKKVKIEAKSKGMTFAAYVRQNLENTLSDQDLYNKFPILKYAGIVKGAKDDSDNDKIDEFLYGTELQE